MGLIAERIKYELLGFSQRASSKLNKRQAMLAEEVKENGYAYFPNFIDEHKLNSLVEIIRLHFSESREEFLYKGDTRHYGIESTVPQVSFFSSDAQLLDIGSKVMSRQLINLFTLGNYLIAGNQGTSGGGWHRDSTHPQFKAMLYLTDVTELNGPLEIIPGTHKFSNLLRLNRKGFLPYNQQWLTESEITAIENEHGNRVAVTGKAGSLILFESSTLHRGRPIEYGERLALTNYYYPKSSNHQQILKNFGVV